MITALGPVAADLGANRVVRGVKIPHPCGDPSLDAAGEAARIPQITDVVEPRAKSRGGTAGVFPGVLGPVEPAGNGRTDRLRGVAVVTSGEVPWLGQKGLFVAHDSVLDTAGPGAELHP